MASVIILQRQEQFMDFCIWCGDNLMHFSLKGGRFKKMYCDGNCLKNAFDFKKRLEKLILAHPEFVDFCLTQINMGMPAVKLNMAVKFLRKYHGPIDLR